ncbi:MAG: hypothetical protein KJ550_11270 [Proteobacteria bacterium]|nr:hypothetical protein [Desulfobacteraceae bacterium]MBU2522482.1 hypothetical protein [Pseudomonadota bacterium]MBU3980385.1 hypothetical protein [Pseudomonadota bacterium]MBU4014034.1 hypothetical protein [Pseudomonadota bacterium]MBU4066861.1 hypothetical protein [Pseudomonadota bacterium]
MAEGTLFAELIKSLDQFDRKLIFVLDDLREKQNRMTLITSRFELCGSLHIEYNSDNVKKLDRSLRRLLQAKLFSVEPESGFSIATKTISEIHQVGETEKLIIYLGRLFSI